VTISLHPVEDPSCFGVVETAPDGRVLNFVEKPPRHEATTNLINAGFYVFEPEALEKIDPDRPVNVERETFPLLSKEGTLFALVDNEYWLDTGTPQHYLQANVDVLKGRNSRHDFKGIEGGSWQHPSATVDVSATIVNSVVDRDCVVGADVLLEDVVLLPGAVIQSGCVVRTSIIGPEAVIGANSELGATCVVGAKEHVASESRLFGDVRLGGV
jgi:mannose-1-phosphate guanylyltransferase